MRYFHPSSALVAQEEVTGVLKRAEHCSPSSPEPQQVLASMLYELGKADEALSSLRGSMSKWLHRYGAAS